MNVFSFVSHMQRLLNGKGDSSLDELLTIISHEAGKENMLVYFTFIENTCLLKIRNMSDKSDELSIRQFHQIDEITSFDELKLLCLKNVFLITNTVLEDDDASSEKQESERSSSGVLEVSENVPPRPIRDAEAHIRKRGVPVTKKSIENYLQRYSPLKDMDKETKQKVLDYLRGMKE